MNLKSHEMVEEPESRGRGRTSRAMKSRAPISLPPFTKDSSAFNQLLFRSYIFDLCVGEGFSKSIIGNPSNPAYAPTLAFTSFITWRKLVSPDLVYIL